MEFLPPSSLIVPPFIQTQNLSGVTTTRRAPVFKSCFYFQNKRKVPAANGSQAAEERRGETVTKSRLRRSASWLHLWVRDAVCCC